MICFDPLSLYMSFADLILKTNTMLNKLQALYKITVTLF